ncbi:MAG: polysaccharide deacetylase family protein [Verrucomicrobiota bacterium]
MTRLGIIAILVGASFPVVGQEGQDLTVAANNAAPSQTEVQYKGKVSFTFDCAQWGDKGLPHILKVCKEKGIKASFFATGRFLEVNKEGLAAIVADGHEVANHSYEHDKKNSIAECDRVGRIYTEATGKKMAPYFRAPFLYERGIDWNYYASKGWEDGYVSIITCDSLTDFDYITDSQFIHYFERYVKYGSDRRIAIHQTKSSGPVGNIDGASILMHIDGYRFHLLGQMIDICHRYGYKCTTFGEACSKAGKAGTYVDPNGLSTDEIKPDKPKEDPIGNTTLTSTEFTMEPVETTAVPRSAKIEAAQEAFSAGTSDDAKGKVSITFNCDYYHPKGLESTLRTLQAHNVQSTFYITGGYLKNHPFAVKAILEAGHEIANHSINHEKTTKTPEDAQRLSDIFEEQMGQKMVPLFRPPYLNERGMSWDEFEAKGWQNGKVSLITCDSIPKWKKVSDAQFMANFKEWSRIAPTRRVAIVQLPAPTDQQGNLDGSVVLMHTNGYRYHLLGEMITHLKSQGYDLVAQSKL